MTVTINPNEHLVVISDMDISDQVEEIFFHAPAGEIASRRASWRQDMALLSDKQRAALIVWMLDHITVPATDLGDETTIRHYVERVLHADLMAVLAPFEDQPDPVLVRRLLEPMKWSTT